MSLSVTATEIIAVLEGMRRLKENKENAKLHSGWFWGRWRSGQSHWTVNPTAICLRGFESLPAHKQNTA